MPTKVVQKVALITGASDGLGTVVTQMFLEAGHHPRSLGSLLLWLASEARMLAEP